MESLGKKAIVELTTRIGSNQRRIEDIKARLMDASVSKQTHYELSKTSIELAKENEDIQAEIDRRRPIIKPLSRSLNEGIEL